MRIAQQGHKLNNPLRSVRKQTVTVTNCFGFSQVTDTWNKDGFMCILKPTGKVRDIMR